MTSNDQSRTLTWTVVAASFGFALVQLDVTIVNVALPQIASALKSDVAALQWVVDAYALAFAALLLTAGFLGDRFGARKLYLAGLGLFAAASVACGFAPDAATLIAARAVQGVGAAAMLPCSLTLINHAAGGDATRRARAIAWWTAAGSIAIALGPIVGGLILGATGWRAIFLVNLPVCAIGAGLTLRVDETAAKRGHDGFDLPGQVLAIVALSAITGFVIEARPLGASVALVAIGAVGIACAIGFVVVEGRSRAPMLPLRLFEDRGFDAAVAYGIVVNLTLYGVIFVLSLYLQRVRGLGPVQTGIAYLPLTATLFVANLVSGRWVAQAGPRVPMIAGAVIDAAGFACLSLTGPDTSYGLLLPAFVLIPAGMGLGVPAMTAAILGRVDRERSGIASGVLNAARQAGGAVGVALFGTLAGDGRDHVVAGLHAAAWIACGLLLAVAAVAFVGIEPGPPAKGA